MQFEKKKNYFHNQMLISNIEEKFKTWCCAYLALTQWMATMTIYFSSADWVYGTDPTDGDYWPIDNYLLYFSSADWVQH